MPSKTKLPDGVVPDTKLFQGTIEGINDLGALSGYKYVLVDDKFIQTSEGALSPNSCYLNTGNEPVEGVTSLVIGKGPNEVIILEEGKENLSIVTASYLFEKGDILWVVGEEDDLDRLLHPSYNEKEESLN